MIFFERSTIGRHCVKNGTDAQQQFLRLGLVDVGSGSEIKRKKVGTVALAKPPALTPLSTVALDQGGGGESRHIKKMCRISKDTPMPTSAPKASADHVPNMAAMTRRLGLDTVAAAWPTGVSHLAQAVVACQRCEAGEVCTDWLARAPAKLETAPAFCPNVLEFKCAKQAKQHG